MSEKLFEKYPALKRLLEVATLANEASIHQDGQEWKGEGDPVDVALLFAAQKAGLKQAELLEQYPEQGRIPYESEQKFAASFHKDDGRRACVKGAVETLLEMSSQQTEDTALDKDAIKQQEQRLSEQQYRVLAFAEGTAEQKESYEPADLKELTFLGMVGLRDPLRKEAKSAISDCQQAGIEVVMITGDHPDTAYAIAEELGLCDDKDQIITGKQLQDASEDENKFDELTGRGTVYARVEPTQKLDIIQSLTRRGHFVAVTGDGVNDAPALKHAHVGVAMGKKGTDVARESAEIILTDDNFSSIVAGVEEGRIVYNNVRKIVYFLMTTSVAEILLFLLAIASSLPVPLFAMQLLWINFVTNGVQDVALAFEPAEGDELKQKPRDPKEPIFNRMMVTRIAITALVMGGVAFGLFYVLLEWGYSEADARSMLVLQMVLFENVLALNSRSETRSIFRHPFFSNPLLLWGTVAAQLLHIGALYTPFLSDVLKIQPVSFKEWSVLLGLALILLVVVEVEKALRRRFQMMKA